MLYTTPKELLSEIKKIMDIQDIPLKELASRLGTSQQNISKIFQQGNPKLDTLLKICNVLNIEVSVKVKDDE